MDGSILQVAGAAFALAFFFLVVLLIIFFTQLKRQSKTKELEEIKLSLAHIKDWASLWQTQLLALTEKVAGLEPVTMNINQTLAAELGRVREKLGFLQEQAQARKAFEEQAIASVKRLEMIIAGTHSKGAAGENIVELVFSKLPVEWQSRNFKVKGLVVEFGLRLPNNLILPIDSKWPATHLIERLGQAQTAQEREILKKEIEKELRRKAEEVSKYLDPSTTMPFAIAVVPDAVYELSAGVQSEAFKVKVVLVSYSMFLPYLFLTIQTALTTMQGLDLQKLNNYLASIEKSLEAMQEELNGRLARALTMLFNSKDELQAQLSKASGNITSLRISAPEAKGKLPPGQG